MEDLWNDFSHRFQVKSYRRNCQKGNLRVQGNVSSEIFFWIIKILWYFSQIRPRFGTTDDKFCEGSREKQDFWKNQFLKKKLRTSSGKLSADLRTAFFVSTGKYWGKSCSPQGLYSIYNNFGLWTKNTRQVFQTGTRAVQSNISNKVLFSGRNTFLSSVAN